MTKSMRRGFTLVELLIVIAIIGVLVGLLLPAINAAREAARRATCVNNLRQFATALTSFETAKQRYPGAREEIKVPGSPANIASWHVLLMPYMDQQQVEEQFRQSNSPSTPYIDSFYCPSAQSPRNTEPKNTYVANGGFYPRPTIDNVFFAAPFTLAKVQRPANTPFNDKAIRNPPVTGPLIKMPKFSASDMSKDGASNTAVFSENAPEGAVNQGAADWSSPTPTWHASPSSAASSVFVYLYVSESSNAPEPNVLTRAVIPAGPPALHMKPNNGDRNNPNPNGPETWRPFSRHPGGFVMAFADGSTKFIKQEIVYDVYQAIMTPDSSKSDIPQNKYVPTGDDLE